MQKTYCIALGLLCIIVGPIVLNGAADNRAEPSVGVILPMSSVTAEPVDEEEFVEVEAESTLGPLQEKRGKSVLFVQNRTPFNIVVEYQYLIHDESLWTMQVIDAGTVVPLGFLRNIGQASIRFKTYGEYMSIGAKYYALAERGITLPLSGVVCIDITLQQEASYLGKLMQDYAVQVTPIAPPRYTTLADVFARTYYKLPYVQQFAGSRISQAVSTLVATTVEPHMGEIVKQEVHARLYSSLVQAAKSHDLAYTILGLSKNSRNYYRFHANPDIGPAMKAAIEAAYQSRFDSLVSGWWIDLSDDRLVAEVHEILLLAVHTLLSTSEQVLPLEEFAERQAKEERIARLVQEHLLSSGQSSGAPKLRVQTRGFDL
jgi:hypothetical protein